MLHYIVSKVPSLAETQDDPFREIIRIDPESPMSFLFIALVVLILVAFGYAFLMDWLFEVLNLFPQAMKEISEVINRNTHGTIGSFIFYIIGVPGMAILFIKIVLSQIITSFSALQDILQYVAEQIGEDSSEALVFLPKLLQLLL
ncbi:MAG: hypothetical protein ACXAB4_03975 [Candidatus Hodarchaeales archaeon]|jgi:hypothetical protein